MYRTTAFLPPLRQSRIRPARVPRPTAWATTWGRPYDGAMSCLRAEGGGAAALEHAPIKWAANQTAERRALPAPITCQFALALARRQGGCRGRSNTRPLKWAANQTTVPLAESRLHASSTTAKMAVPGLGIFTQSGGRRGYPILYDYKP